MLVLGLNVLELMEEIHKGACFRSVKCLPHCLGKMGMGSWVLRECPLLLQLPRIKLDTSKKKKKKVLMFDVFLHLPKMGAKVEEIPNLKQ